MKTSGIYKIQSKAKPERIYIGSAVSLKKRWNTHLNSLRQGTHHSKQLQRHYNKHGESDLIFIILEPCFPEFLIIREQFYIDTTNPYFNTCKTAGSTLGYKYSEETIKEIQESRKWYKPTKDTCVKISKSLEGNKRSEGYKHTPETLKNMSVAQSGEKNAMFGKAHSEETKQKIRERALGRVISEETKGKLRTASKGVNNHFFNKHHTEESRRKISEKAKGRIVSEVTKLKIGASQKGKHTGKDNPMFGVHRFGKDNPMFGKHLSKENCEKISERNRNRSDETRHKLSEAGKNRKHTEEELITMSIAQKAAWVIRKKNKVA